MFRRLCAALILTFSTTFSFALADPAQVGTLNGTARDSSGAPVSGARVTVAGPQNLTLVTDAKGQFTAQLPPGLYSVDVTKGGYVPEHANDVAIFSGEALPLAITMVRADLSSLRTIATVSTSRGGSINTGAASVSTITAAEIQNYPDPQINNLLQHVPDLTIQKMGSQPDTTIVLGGAQPYETQVLIDGHPLALGQYGVWISEYFPSFLLTNVETQTGPGNTTPFANTAVGGTANLVTDQFTSQQHVALTLGVDSYASQNSSFLASGTLGKLQYVTGVGYGSANGPYYQGNECVVSPDPNPNNAGKGIVQFCGDSSASLFNKGEILKLRYNFSQATAFDVGFIGAFGGYLPQGTSYGQYLGQMTVEPCYTVPNYGSSSPGTPGIPGSTSNFCTNPNNSNLIGKTINAYAWYPGSNVYYNQPIFTGQLRQAIGNDTLLIRPYAGNINWIVDGSGEAYYPYAFSEAGLSTTDQGYFEQACNNYNYLGQINTYPAPKYVNGQEECFQAPFSELEQDKLYGTTVSYLHPIGTSLINFTYDYHGDNVFAYYNTPQDIAVPNTLERFTTISLSGDISVARNLMLKAGLYDTLWHLTGSEPAPNQPTGTLQGLDRSLGRFDPHLGLAFQPRGGISYRAAFGTSETFPFAGQVSGIPFNTPPSATFPNGYVTQKNPYLDPEVAIEYSVGADKRFSNGSVLSVDLEDSTIHNVFETLSTPNAFANGEALVQPINAARLEAKLATISYRYNPRVGWGYNVNYAFESSIVTGIPNSFYVSGAALPANGQQICGFGNATPGTTTCIPYMKGYGQLSYAFRDGTYVAVGDDFEGKNNTYFQPPFMQFDFTGERPISPHLDVQVFVQNLLNTNNFYNLPEPAQGVSQVAGLANGQLTSLPAVLVPAPPRTLRLQLHWHD